MFFMADRSPIGGMVVHRLTKRNSRWESASDGRFQAPSATIRSMDLNPYESPESQSKPAYEPADDDLAVSMWRFLVGMIAIVYALGFSVYVALRIMCS